MIERHKAVDLVRHQITMANPQPIAVVEGATAGDVEDEIPDVPKSAEDIKAAAALSSLDTRREDDASSTKNVDQDAVKKAMDRLAGTGTSVGKVQKKEEPKEVKKVVKVDPADVAQIVSVYGAHYMRELGRLFL